MSYEPSEHASSLRHVAAAWIVCAALFLLVFGHIALEAHATASRRAEVQGQVCGIDMVGSESRTGCVAERMVKRRA
jgi:hypothetical protein